MEYDSSKRVVARPRMPMSERAKIFMPFDALKGYREAAARGVSAAVDALARHATHENDKDVRRSEKVPAVSLAPLAAPAKSEAK